MSAVNSGLPQLDYTTFPNQLFWLIVTFAACYFINALFVIPNIRFCVANRKKKVDMLLYEAQQANLMVDNIAEQLESLNFYAISQAEEIIRRAQENASKMVIDHARHTNEEFSKYVEIADESKKVKLQEAMSLLPEVVKEVVATIEVSWVHSSGSRIYVREH